MPMKNVTFDNVLFTNPGKKPFGDKYFECQNVQGVAIGSTWPVPNCFEDQTTQALDLMNTETIFMQ